MSTLLATAVPMTLPCGAGIPRETTGTNVPDATPGPPGIDVPTLRAVVTPRAVIVTICEAPGASVNDSGLCVKKLPCLERLMTVDDPPMFRNVYEVVAPPELDPTSDSGKSVMTTRGANSKTCVACLCPLGCVTVS